MKTETCSPAQHKIKYDVLDVKCLSFNIELQHIGMSALKEQWNITIRQATGHRLYLVIYPLHLTTNILS